MHPNCINILFTLHATDDGHSAAPLSSPAGTPPGTRTRVAIAGATGYAGQELVRILARHPAVTLTTAMSSGATSAPRPMPALARIWDGTVVPLDVERLVADADIVFLALPEAASAELAPVLVERGRRVIDLSGAFRIRDDAERQRWYPATAALPSGTVYGFSERNRRPSAMRGCSPTRAAIRPPRCWRPSRWPTPACSTGPVVVDAKSGVSGAGKTPSDRTHFSENHGSVAAYGIFGIATPPRWSRSCPLPVTFVPHLVPLDRGILETIYVAAPSGDHRSAGRRALNAAYADAPFVRLTGDALPEIKHVAHTNFCDIGWKVDEAGRAPCWSRCSTIW